uniref:Uncharacterized protein n=1 Tax=Cannabis sativa TaxID=3483 RepID=A0A803PAR1_CANSA
MSEVLQDLHKHGFFGFDKEILELHHTNSMSNPNVSSAKSSKKGPKKLATLEEVMQGPFAYKKYSCCSNDWEANEIHSTLTCAHQLEKIVAVNGTKLSGSGVYHRLPRDEETPNHNYNNFGAWSQTHLMSEAMLPLGWAAPRPAEILYFYKLLSVPKKGDKFKDGFYKLQAHLAIETPVLAGYKKEDLNVGDLVMTANCRRVNQLIQEKVGKEKTPARPKFPFPVLNFGTPGASTSKAPKPMDNLLAMLATTHSPKLKVPNPPQVMVTPGGPTEEVPGNQEVVLIKEEEEEVPPLDWEWKAEDFPAPLAILLTPAYPDEERVQLHIAKHNYAVDELSKGNVEVDALIKRLREVHDGPFQGEYTGEVWDLNLDPMTDWSKHYLGPTLAPFTSEMEIQGLTEKLKTLKELHKTNLETTASMSVELYELREFWERTQKEAPKATREALLTPKTCKHCAKIFEDGVFMCWKSNKFEPHLHFMLDPEATMVCFWEKNKKLEQVLAEWMGPRLPSRAD